MRNDGTRRRSLSNLFAERQVYMRSGLHSHYVVLSRPLQIGVALGCAGILALLAAASYNVIAKHFDVAAQRQALADLEAARDDRSAGSLASLREQGEAAKAEALRLSAALDDAEAERLTSQTAAREADEKIAALSAALDASQAALETARSDAATQARELAAALAAATSESRNLATQLQEIRASGEVRNATLSTRLEAALTEATGLRAELDRASREIAGLRRTARAQQPPGNPGSQPGASQASPPGAPPIDDQSAAGRASGPGSAPEPAALQILQLKEELAGAKATIDVLTADLAAAKGVPTGAERATGRAMNVAADPAQGDLLPSPPAPR